MSSKSILGTETDKRNDKSKFVYPALGVGIAAVTMVISGIAVAMPYWVQFDESVRTSENGIEYDVSIKFTHGLWDYCNVVTAKGQTTEKCGKIKSFSDSDLATQSMVVISIIMCLCTVIMVVLYLSKLRQLSGLRICLYIAALTSVISALVLISGVTVYGIADHNINITDSVILKFTASNLYICFWLAVVGCLTNLASVVFIMLTIFTNEMNKKKETTATSSSKSSLREFDSAFKQQTDSPRTSMCSSEESSDEDSDVDYLTRHPHPLPHPHIVTPSNLAFRFTDHTRNVHERDNENINANEHCNDKVHDATGDRLNEEPAERNSNNNNQVTSENQKDNVTHHQIIGSGFIPEITTTEDGETKANDKEVCEPKMSDIMKEILSEPECLHAKDDMPNSVLETKPTSEIESNLDKTRESLPRDEEAVNKTITPADFKLHGQFKDNEALDHTTEKNQQSNTNKHQPNKATVPTDGSTEAKGELCNIAQSNQPVPASGYISLPQDVQGELDKGDDCKEGYPISLDDKVGSGKPPIDTRECVIPAILNTIPKVVSTVDRPPVFNKTEIGKKRPFVVERHTYHDMERVKSVYSKAAPTVPQYPEIPRKQKKQTPPVLKNALPHHTKGFEEMPSRTESDC